ncbi:YjzD family protein [Pediococcus claussenii]|nr:YjzD family protein [Pediococcus claussenii]
MAKQLTIIFWSILFGEVVGYIGGALDKLPDNPIIIGVVAALVALLTANLVPVISGSKK